MLPGYAHFIFNYAPVAWIVVQSNIFKSSMLQGGAYLNAQCEYNKFQTMLLEHVGLNQCSRWFMIQEHMLLARADALEA